jgi:AmiR/NasT family two-component response regulator
VPQSEAEQLRVVIANERKDRLELVAPMIAGLGHEVVAREVEVAEAEAIVAAERPDLVIVGLGHGSSQALLLIERIVREAACPVVVHVHAPAVEFVRDASRRGIFAQIRDGDQDDWRNAIEIALHRFAEYRDLEGALARRAIIERAKGILMERHSVDEQRAFVLLRDQARRTNRKLVDVAAAVLDGHHLLPANSHITPTADTATEDNAGFALAPRERRNAGAADSSAVPRL